MTLLVAGEISIETPPSEIFNYWVNERWQILKRREAGEGKPWSEDPIMRSIYFCNVRREDDKTTKFVRDWAKDWKMPQQLVVGYTFARFMNLPSTLRHFDLDIIITDPDYVLDRMKEIRCEGKKLFSGAYLISTCGQKMDKLDYVMNVVNEVYRLVECKPTLQEQWEELTKINGLGNFLAAQIVADLKNTKGTAWYDAVDKDTFVARGPGSVRGMNWYLHGESRESMSDLEFKRGLDIARSDLYATYPELPLICNQDLQNCFCEFSKYMRVLHGGGTKRKYQGL